MIVVNASAVEVSDVSDDLAVHEVMRFIDRSREAAARRDDNVLFFIDVMLFIVLLDKTNNAEKSKISS